MKCHVVLGLNVALYYVIAVRNGIIPRNGYNESFYSVPPTFLFIHVCEKCFEILYNKILQNLKS